MKIRVIKSTLLITFCSLFLTCQSQQEFVKVKDTNFTIDGKTHHFVGANFWFGAYLGADTDYGNRPRLIRELDQLKKNGITNLRVVAASEESDYGLPLSPPFQYKNGTYNEKLLEGLDFLLDEMGKRDMHAVMVLNNNWDWSGGMGQYVSWINKTPVIDPSVNKNETWNDYLKEAGKFYELQEAQDIYRKYIKMIVNRTNTFSKKMYNNDPAIMSWQLANEPRPSVDGDPEGKMKIFTKWVDGTAAYIKSMAPKQLVSTGSEGSQGTLNSLEFTYRAHSGKNIDYVTFHMWPKNWAWYKAEAPDMENAKKKTVAYFDEHLALAKKLNKPIVMEEFGFVRDGEKFSPDSPTTARDEYYTFVLDLLKNSVKNNGTLGGLNFWGWGGEGRGQQKDYMWKKGDISFTADPYSEAQGLNSIYNTDKSTIELINKSAKEIQELSRKSDQK
ncbi:glycoside hydrolase 5 family protein [Flavobacterium sp. TMP13]|uniref:glycoside hydrolase 5 family protein n=1 Tax=Flavobacterium sp. TMP13 TaxID=3425950 RepID=UPI003D777FD9